MHYISRTGTGGSHQRQEYETPVAFLVTVKYLSYATDR